ncbi:MAG: homocysteine S-methyltransferase family protein [Rhodobacter sp.]|nr:homocysteine S-methyltransferase family protein [Rhodobacter sp.]MCA3457469.1 homocysteine S-methyltransferase family protein [Rhodobacter sp.]MCA3461324.1 homocysteine S-methyltransferase family protein [Rhodobacter sp.]MCA3463723.1 homocysteine S-methyltransferase family protein [Rhodobacter sp.]MCA3467891.1 homocysteine S-methyltransferase family protein [Rhodobacter sp.]
MITLLDGGMGQELIARSGDAPTPLWATQVMIDHPGLVQAIHADYFAAGASMATTNTYALHRDRLAGTPAAAQFAALHAQALAEARAARDGAGKGRLAGSIGPLGASYRADVGPAHETATRLYAEIAAILAPQVDVILGETIATLAQARALLEAALPMGRPVWLSVTVDDRDGTRLRSGEPVAGLAAIARDGAAAVLANCSAPEAMTAALEALSAANLPYGCYANGFQQITDDFLKDRPTVDALSARPEMVPELYADFAEHWVRQGATIIGGCCETTPAHIAAIARRLTDRGYALT